MDQSKQGTRKYANTLAIHCHMTDQGQVNLSTVEQLRRQCAQLKKDIKLSEAKSQREIKRLKEAIESSNAKLMTTDSPTSHKMGMMMPVTSDMLAFRCLLKNADRVREDFYMATPQPQLNNELAKTLKQLGGGIYHFQTVNGDVKPIDLFSFQIAQKLDPSQFPEIWEEDNVIEVRHCSDYEVANHGLVTWPRTLFHPLLAHVQCPVEKNTPRYQELMEMRNEDEDPYYCRRLEGLIDDFLAEQPNSKANEPIPMAIFLTLPFSADFDPKAPRHLKKTKAKYLPNLKVILDKLGQIAKVYYTFFSPPISATFQDSTVMVSPPCMKDAVGRLHETWEMFRPKTTTHSATDLDTQEEEHPSLRTRKRLVSDRGLAKVKSTKKAKVEET